MSHVVRALGVAALALGGLIWASASQAADLVSVGPSKGGPSKGVPYAAGPCADRGFLNRISARFNHQVRNVPNLPNVAIRDFRGIHEHRYHARERGLADLPPLLRRDRGACRTAAIAISGISSRAAWALPASAGTSNSACRASTAGSSITDGAASCAE